MRTSLSRSMIAAALLSGAAASAASATILTFDGTGHIKGGGIGQSYGDNVTSTSSNGGLYQYSLDCGATPNVIVNYINTSTTEVFFERDGYGDMTNFIHAFHDVGAAVRLLEVTLINTTGAPIYLFGFDVAALLGETLGVNSIQVRNGQTQEVLFDAPKDHFGSLVGVPGFVPPGRKSFTFMPALVAPVLTIRIDLSNLGGKSDRVGLDNIKFGETDIPSPGAGALALCAAGLLAASRRRRA